MKPQNIIRVAVFVAAGIMVCLIIWAGKRKEQKIAPFRIMPEINALTISGDSLKVNEALDTTKRTSILFFGPDCEFCQKEIEGIIKRSGECRAVQWLFITIAQPEELEPFLKEYPVDSIPNAFLLREDFPEMHIKFDVLAPPALFIYDEHGKLMKMHRGATSIKTIVEELQ